MGYFYAALVSGAMILIKLGSDMPSPNSPENLGLTQDIFFHLTEFFLCYLSFRISLFQYF
jgi:hypothetical protein